MSVPAARMKLPAILASAVGAGLALLSWSQTWFDVQLADATASGSGEVIAVPGSIASPALAALGLAGLALVAALAIAGPVIRIVLGILEVVLGGAVLLAAGLSIGDPIGAVSPAVTEATGVSGAGPTAELVAASVPTAWPVAAVVGGILLVAAGILVLATGTRWPSSSRRYRSARLVEAEGTASTARRRGAASDRAIDDWDELSRGDDPTAAAADSADDEPHGRAADERPGKAAEEPPGDPRSGDRRA